MSFNRTESHGVEIFTEDQMTVRWVEVCLAVFPPGLEARTDAYRQAFQG
jgi:hypothetical protein